MSTVQVDAIAESTTNAGVTVDGVLIKDNAVNTDTITEKTSGSGVTVDGLLIRDGAIPSISGGKVLQVVTGTDNTEQIITSTSFVDSGLSASITPSATSSKILVLIQHNFEMYRGSVDQTGYIQLLRDSTVISDITANIGAGNAGYVFNTQTISMKVLDTPSTTSAITYKTQARVNNTANSGQVKTGDDNNLETMVLMEIAG